MTRCDDFYHKVEKDGNFCGMAAGEYQRLLKIRDLQANNLDLSKLPASTLIPLVAVKGEALKNSVIQAIVKDINAGEQVTRATVTNYIRILGETKETKETTDIECIKETTDIEDTDEEKEDKIAFATDSLTDAMVALRAYGITETKITEVCCDAIARLYHAVIPDNCLCLSARAVCGGGDECEA